MRHISVSHFLKLIQGEIPSQILYVLSIHKIRREQRCHFPPPLILSALFLDPTMHLIWYSEELYSAIWQFLLKKTPPHQKRKKGHSFTYLCKSTRMLGRRFSFWAPNLAKALTAAITKHKMKQRKYWFLALSNNHSKN